MMEFSSCAEPSFFGQTRDGFDGELVGGLPLQRARRHVEELARDQNRCLVGMTLPYEGTEFFFQSAKATGILFYYVPYLARNERLYSVSGTLGLQPWKVCGHQKLMKLATKVFTHNPCGFQAASL